MKAIIIGGGIAGLTAAISLQKAGHDVEVYEATTEFKPVGAGLVLAGNAIRAFEYLGIAKDVLLSGNLIPQLLIKDEKGKIISFIESRLIKEKFGVDNFAIHRADLHNVLFTQAAKSKIFTGKKARSFRETDAAVEVDFEDGTKTAGDYLIAADGIHSAIRRQLLPLTEPRFSGYTCWRSVVPQLSTPVLSPSESWGAGARFGIVPLVNNRIYWYATLNSREGDATMKKYTPKDLQKAFADFHDPIHEILAITHKNQLLWNDIIDLEPLSQFAHGKVLLIGDAAHATTPNMGQGACMAIEDAAILLPVFQKHGNNIRNAFIEFEQRRIPRTHKIVNSSRKLGQIGQWENKLARTIRNRLMKSLPDSIRLKQLSFLYDIRFD